MTEQEKRRIAELETDQARAGRNAAELQRDVIAGVAVTESVHRAVAEDAASEAKTRAAQAESRERTMATSASLARQDATYERAAASNASFSATLITIVAVTIVLAVIGYFAWWQPNHQVDASTNTFIRTDKTTEKSSPTPNVIVKQPNVNVKVVVPESKPKPDEQTPSEIPPESDKGDGTGHPSDSDTGKTPDTRSGTDNP